MGFRTLIINVHSKLSYKNNHLVFKTAEQTEMIHLSEIDTIICETTDIVITTMLLDRLVDKGILVIFCDSKRLPSSMLMPYYARHDSSLQVRLQTEWPTAIKSVVWTKIIAQKLANQASVLGSVDLIDKKVTVERVAAELILDDPSNVEAHVARTYFNALFGNDFVRDEPTEINKALDYGYALIMSLFAREVAKCGCITQIGMKHTNQFNQFNLASDLMEPFRVLVDQIVYENRQESFPRIKRQLFNLFANTFAYGGKDMYLNNIVSDFVRKVIDCLHEERDNVPEFRVNG
jgi:CRISPR-associated endonuclease Cas1